MPTKVIFRGEQNEPVTKSEVFTVTVEESREEVRGAAAASGSVRLTMLDEKEVWVQWANVLLT